MRYYFTISLAKKDSVNELSYGNVIVSPVLYVCGKNNSYLRKYCQCIHGVTKPGEGKKIQPLCFQGFRWES
mgnify:CR=1 FL=1